MVDDKKIEKACDRALKSSVFNDNVHAYTYVSGFYDCAKWMQKKFLKDLWHPASEKPRRNTVCLAQIGKYVFDTFYDSENWESYSKGINITRWLYVDDLIPKLKEGDEQ